MTSGEEYLFGWESHIELVNKLLLKWRYIRDMPEIDIPMYIGARESPVMAEEIKKLAIVQVDLLQSILHNIEHDLIGIKCNCQRVEIAKDAI